MVTRRWQWNLFPAHPLRRASAIPRQEVPGLWLIDLRPGHKGAGNAGRTLRPRPRVQNKKAHEPVTTVTPGSPGIPRAVVLTASSALSSVIGLCCHRHRRK